MYLYPTTMLSYGLLSGTIVQPITISNGFASEGLDKDRHITERRKKRQYESSPA